MIVLNRPSELAAYVGKTLGSSEWMLVDQTLIDQFASVTRDDGWYHTDVLTRKKGTARRKDDRPGLYACGPPTGAGS